MQIIPANTDEKIAALRQNSYFSALHETALEKLAQGSALRHYASDEIVCWQGEPCENLFFVRRGSVKLFKLSARGRELIIRVFTEGATFNEVPVFDSGLNPVNVAVLEDSDIWAVDAAAIRNVLLEYPEAAQAVILNLSKNLRMLVAIVEELSFCQVTNRLARLLCRLPLEQGHDVHVQYISQDQLAARLGTVREVVARSLRDLERSGAIRVRRRQIQIVDESILKDWAAEPIAE